MPLIKSALSVARKGTASKVEIRSSKTKNPSVLTIIREELDKIEKVIGERPEIEMGSLRADQQMFRRTKVIVASKDTLHPKRLERFKPDQFSLIITDEAHHAVAATGSGRDGLKGGGSSWRASHSSTSPSVCMSQ